MHISQFGGVLVDPWVSVLVRTYIRLSTEYGYYGVQSISNTTPCNIIMYYHLLYLLYLYPTLSKAHAGHGPVRFARSLSVHLLGQHGIS